MFIRYVKSAGVMSRISKAKYKDVVTELRKKPINWDKDYTDVLGIDEAKHNRQNTIEVPKDSHNPIHEFLRKWGNAKLLIGKKAFCLTDRKEVMSGFITKVMPPCYLLLKDKGVADFSDCISLEG